MLLRHVDMIRLSKYIWVAGIFAYGAIKSVRWNKPPNKTVLS